MSEHGTHWAVIELSDHKVIQEFGSLLKALEYAGDLMSKGNATTDTIDVVMRVRLPVWPSRNPPVAA